MTALLGLVTGVAFGAALVLGGLSSPNWIVGMLRLRELRLLKLLVTAIATGMLGIALLGELGLAHTEVKTLHLLAVLGGGLLFGVGFAVTGYCPGTALAGSAEGRADAPFVVLGGLAGTALFAVLYAALAPLLVEPLTYGKPTLATWLGVRPLWIALPLAALAAIVIARWWRAERPRGDRSAVTPPFADARAQAAAE
jgi:hypothetical protein